MPGSIGQRLPGAACGSAEAATAHVLRQATNPSEALLHVNVNVKNSVATSELDCALIQCSAGRLCSRVSWHGGMDMCMHACVRLRSFVSLARLISRLRCCPSTQV